jgi:hypothetical protein
MYRDVIFSVRKDKGVEGVKSTEAHGRSIERHMEELKSIKRKFQGILSKGGEDS